MLTNFFSNSKPFHFISINLLLFVGYTLYNFQISNFEHGIIELILSTFKFSLYIALMLIFGFIIKKNKLTQINSYALFSFGCFLLMVPILFQDSKPVFSLLFLLLALRRILSFNSKKKYSKKNIRRFLMDWHCNTFLFLEPIVLSRFICCLNSACH